ncbi:MAG: energy-coupling factor ABC transporter substrate-binding protein [Candidatus Competibacteraceae bacterium]|uniref:Cobalt transport protein CbiN n=1 Tax=Candidatus Contendobacter odensis Run_B_J11 TaxID=1400861 RepID=A0A7U7J209_9GAMM|nr:energy-coupling factor ABC transporter substrate-binding protein [Candidatus Contendobacter odensis]MBK8537527.1 energy-coupling factor ABC transporter substrate-binding protein [Candidatus Competibacteraceae bacterium]MBK8751489.1 energy-coupling factor ABC transporter substrate-binding protein [Candidatus Competibacteraceae bacterium]CDH43566.1 Cobalt transport protein cbiN [Candidatus Contendobacter odensis Run_B_J11]
MNRHNLSLIAVAVVLVVVSLVVGSRREGAEFAGADGQAMAAATALHPDYQPWFKPVWEPPSGEVASLLFALQAALGAGVLGYYLGFKRGQSRQRQPDRVDAGD